jgi:hypothetical protein
MQAMFNLFLSAKEQDLITARAVIFRNEAP